MFFIGLNDSVRGAILREACEEVAPVHSIKFHRHPKTKTFLGAATVCFAGMGGGRKALSELDGKIVGGCYLRAELDDTGWCVYHTDYSCTVRPLQLDYISLASFSTG